MNLDTSNSEGESMDIRKEQRSPSLSPLPPPLKELEIFTRSTHHSVDWANLIAHLDNPFTSIDNFNFTNGNEKSQYANKIVSLITEAIEYQKNSDVQKMPNTTLSTEEWSVIMGYPSILTYPSRLPQGQEK
ncbi:hypothetical protein TNCT_601321 [Trichonephila clavata]|uniref:Uncharacterized protein n=1 Tax=Trichonephila clavata TaxID=2740835 RepID=A0A8X6F4R7_TRICU|nr:hypothetical protein TNCT_601321 [Trichonephila clavata]